jgi:hypothetical protein
LDALNTKAALKRAREADAASIVKNLRNSLAWRVTYLDKDGRQTSGDARFLVSRNSDSSHNSRAGHPGWRRCSSLKYAQYSRSSRLAIRAPRSGTYATNNCSGTLAFAGAATAERPIKWVAAYEPFFPTRWRNEMRLRATGVRRFSLSSREDERIRRKVAPVGCWSVGVLKQRRTELTARSPHAPSRRSHSTTP